MKKIIENFKGKKILVIGDVMLDKYIYGSVTRISPEAPVQVVKVEKESYVPGGAANVANNIAALGGRAILVGAVGKDPGAEILTRILNEKDVKTEFFVWNAPTIVKVRVVGQSQQLLRIDYEDETTINAQEISKKIIKLAADADVIIISDYAKGTINEEVMKTAVASGKKVIIDPKPKNFRLYKGAFLIKPNFSEAKEIAGTTDVSEMGRKLKEQTNSNILITKGKEGMSLFEIDGSNLHVPTEAREVYDVTGAGDTVTAALA
ncbi:MAG: PfkB family carbohydrate kinase, partial [Candidatus Woesearchaeota archaeon]